MKLLYHTLCFAFWTWCLFYMGLLKLCTDYRAPADYCSEQAMYHWEMTR